jgi:uncharacterized protein DUF4232
VSGEKVVAMVRTSRLLGQSLATTALLGVLVGCGSEQPPQNAAQTPVSTPATATSPSPSSPPTSLEGTQASGSGPGKCTAATLSGKIVPTDPGAGQRYANLVVTNTATKACTLYGYGGMQLVDANGNPNPTKLTRSPNPGPSLVTLPPGGTAVKKLHWGVVPAAGEPDQGPCQPASAGATVIPPDDTQSFKVTFDFGSVCAKGTIEGSAYHKA